MAVFNSLLSFYKEYEPGSFAGNADECELPDGTVIRRIPNSSYGAVHFLTPQFSFIWKSLIAGNHNGWSELAAYRLSNILKLPHVPDTLLYEAGDWAGTASQFIPDAFSPHDIQFDHQKRGSIRPFLMHSDFIQQAISMFIFDFILGNKDRHAGNWLIHLKTRKLWWIDHGSIRWNYSEKTAMDAFKKFGLTLKVLGLSQKQICQVLTAIQQGLVILPSKHLQGWQAISHQEWCTAFEGMPVQVNHFNREEAREYSWNALQNLLREGGLKIPEAGVTKVLSKIERWRPEETFE